MHVTMLLTTDSMQWWHTCSMKSDITCVSFCYLMASLWARGKSPNVAPSRITLQHVTAPHITVQYVTAQRILLTAQLHSISIRSIAGRERQCFVQCFVHLVCWNATCCTATCCGVIQQCAMLWCDLVLWCHVDYSIFIDLRPPNKITLEQDRWKA